MTSSVTTSFNEIFLQSFKNDLDSVGSQYYVGLARPTELTLGEDFNSRRFQQEFRHGLQSLKTLSNSSFVVPRVDWNNTAIYSAYDDTTNNAYHVMNSLNEVFVCVQQGKEEDGRVKPVTDEPTTTKAAAYDESGLVSRSFRTDDDYIWRYLYKLSNLAVANFLTSGFIPVKTIRSGNEILTITEELSQRNNQDSAVAGEIIGIAIDSAGTNISSAPTITIVGNGTGAKFNCDVVGGKIVRVEIDSDGADLGQIGKPLSHGSGYNYANVVTSVGDAVLRPIISQAGLNAVPLKTLNSSAILLQVDFVGDEFDTILAENDFNQIGVVKDILQFGSTSKFTGDTVNAMKSLDVTITTGGPFAEERVENGGKTAKGVVFYHDTVANKLYYYQDETTGFVPFDFAVDNTVSAVSGGSGTTATFTAQNNPSINAYSGEILYINNVGAEGLDTPTTGITKEDDQTEDIRIVIQLG